MGGRILWALVLGFLTGVFLRSFVPIGLTVAALAWLCALTGLLLAFLDRDKLRVSIVIACALFAFGMGIFRMDLSVQRGDPQLTKLVGEEVLIQGVVVAEPDRREKGDRLTLSARTVIYKGKEFSVRAGVLVLAPPHSGVSYGDEIQATGEVRLPERFDTGEGREFNYPEYLAAHGVQYQLAFAQTQQVSSGHGNPLTAAAITLKRLYVTGMGNALPEPEAGLASGITVGDKRSLGEELTEDFRTVALIHMLVLSGYNITIVLNTVARLFAWAPRLVQVGISGSVVMFFILMSGGAASAVRAGAMALIGVFARVTSRVFLASRALASVALLMVLWNPFSLAFDPGFQLSVLATAGLIFLTPLFSEWLQWMPERFAIRETAAATLGTQTSVLPLLLYQNGQLPIYALPANLFALIPVPLAMLTSFIAAIGGMIFGTYAVVLGLPAQLLLAYIVGVAHFFSSLPYASLSIPAFSAWWIAAAYAALFVAVLYLQKNSGRIVLPAAQGEGAQ